MRAAPWLMFTLVAFSACGGGSDCEGDDCVGTPCGPNGECPAGLVCDLSSNTCIVRGNTADAGVTVDAIPSVDAPPTSGPLTLTLYVAGVPTAFADVAVGNADGTLVTNGQTNTSGVYEFPDFHQGMIVSVVDRATDVDRPSLYVLHGVTPGNIVLGDPALGTARDPMAVSATGYLNSPAYDISNGCARPAPSGALKWTLDVSNECIDPQNNVRLVAYALDPAGNRVAYSVLDTDYPPDGTPEITEWSTDLSSVALTPSNLPAGTNTFAVIGVRNATPAASFSATSITLTGTTLQTQRFAPGAFDAIQSTALNFTTTPASISESILVHSVPVGAGVVNLQESVDYTADFLPFPTDLALDRTAPTRPFVTFGSPAPSFDATLLILVGIKGRAGNYTVIEFAPPGTTSVQIPELPASFADVTPAEEDSLRISGGGFVDVDTIPGYSTFIHLPNPLGSISTRLPSVEGEYTSRVSLFILRVQEE